MFTSIIIELLGAKIAERNEILPNVYSFSKELGSISGGINLNHSRYTHLSATKLYCGPRCYWHNKNLQVMAKE